MKNHNDVRLERVYEKHITIFGRPLRIKRLIIISLLGISLGASIYYESQVTYWLLISLFFFCIALFSFLLYLKPIIYIGDYSLESTPSGDIFITKLFGQCTICLGDLKIVKNKKGTFIQCEEDKTHIWNVENKNIK